MSPPALNLSQNSNKTPQRDPVPVPDSNSSSSPPKLGSMPRRKQARPRRRSGDYEDVDSPTIGQDLRLVSSKSRSCSSPDNSLEDESHLHEGQGHDRHHEGHSEFPFDLEEVGDCPMPNFPGNISIIPNMARFPFLGGQNEAPEPVRRRPGRPRRNVLVSEPPPHKRELPPDFGDGGRRRRSSRLNYGEEEEGGMENGNHIIDYTTVTNSGGLEKAGERERRKKGVAEDHLQQQHLAFLRNYNWAMAERGKVSRRKLTFLQVFRTFFWRICHVFGTISSYRVKSRSVTVAAVPRQWVDPGRKVIKANRALYSATDLLMELVHLFLIPTHFHSTSQDSFFPTTPTAIRGTAHHPGIFPGILRIPGISSPLRHPCR